MKNFIFLFSLVFSALVSFTALAQQDSTPETQTLSEAELAQMLAPIALYPDSLLTHILISSTYPLEIVEAHRWLKKNEGLSSEQAAQSVKDFDWDASVKALVPFERILGRLNDDLGWTQQLGDAFLQDEAKLLESIQALREQAKLAGNLDKMDNMDVSYEDNNIIIEPREKEIVYVPYYDTRMVYGDWYWSSYPPVYWTPYNRIHVSHYSPFHWHSGIHISFSYFFSAFHWHNRHVVVVNPRRSHYRSYHQRPRRLIASGGYAKRWVHQPIHRKGVAYRTKRTAQKYHSKRIRKQSTNKPFSHGLKKNERSDFQKKLSVKNRDSNHRKVKADNKMKPRAIPIPEHKSSRAKVNVKEVKAHKTRRPNISVKKDNSTKVTFKVQRQSTSGSSAKGTNRQIRKKQNHNASVRKYSSKAEKSREK